MRFSNLLFLFLVLSTGLRAAGPAASEPSPKPKAVILLLPTVNDALFRDDPGDFFQPTVSRRIQSGMYGFVRSDDPEPARWFQHFHEGIDIQPTRRGPGGDPLDYVSAAAPGTVVYINNRSGLSNFGNYIVIEHDYGDAKGYTTYGHLASTSVLKGDKVAAGQVIGKMGHTGPDIPVTRAHVHFEFGVMVNRNWAEWFEKMGKKGPNDRNDHGNFNGNNIQGFDPVPILKATKAGDPLTLRAIFEKEPVVFRVRIYAGKDYFDWQKRFPWQVEDGVDKPLPKAWEIDCNRLGTPLAWRRLNEAIDEITLSWFDYSRSTQDSFCRGVVNRTGSKSAELTPDGKRWFGSIFYIP
jgi:murein DD-endopeptidase MepM/ murein hydrolase activator NlpD